MHAPARFFSGITLAELTLRVGDLPGVAAFYRDRLGMREVSSSLQRVELSANGDPPALLVLEAAPDAPRRPTGSAGLFHAAFLLPDRLTLGHALRNVVASGIPFGSADHGVSEALYLQDPEGNGLELYADRPPEAWPRSPSPGQVAMFTAALDLDGLLAAGAESPGPVFPATTRLGHVHLSVSDLGAAQTFYAHVLGFPIRQQDYPGAVFFGRDGYHHHLAANTWRSQRPVTRGARGLERFSLRFADAAEAQRIIERARGGAVPFDENIVRDPDGIAIVVEADR